MKSLVLAEKPSVAKEIARVLGCNHKHKSHIEGPQYVVTWALGHLVGLAEPEDYDTRFQTWKLEDLPIMPDKMKLKILKETQHQYRAISQLAKRADLSELIIATDAGREGELVARWIMELVKWKKPYKRLWISSQTDRAIKEGFSNLKPGASYTPLFHSAVCRAEADWLIGLNVTRALTSKYNAQLSAGRVQTPSLAMMIERDKEIKAFQPVPYSTIQCDFGSLKALWRGSDQNSRIFDSNRAEALREKLQGKPGKVTQIKTNGKHEPHPLAYDLTELQRDANKRYGFSAKQTSNLLQRLYEQYKLVTYPRTDSRYLPADMVSTLKERLGRVAVGPYSALVRPLLNKPLSITKRIVDDSKVTDHHAIIPTDQQPQLAVLSADERKLYDLIVRRFIALFYPNYQYDETTLTIEVSGENVFAKGKVIKHSGWKDIYGSVTLNETDHEDGEAGDNDELHLKGQQLPPLQAGAVLPACRCQELRHFTKAPAKYTEATLLSQMEKHNLGTPATRADIIEKLVSSDTIERQGNSLSPTKKGRQLIDLSSEELRSPELTAIWEMELEKIAKGKGNMQQFLNRIRAQTEKLVMEIKTSDAEYEPHNITNTKCPACSQLLQEIKTKRGRLYVCPDRECGHRHHPDPQQSNKRCPQCRKKMEIHQGKAGPYAQCRRCNVVETLEGNNSPGRQRKDNKKLINQYSDNTSLSSNLGELLKQALEENKRD